VFFPDILPLSFVFDLIVLNNYLHEVFGLIVIIICSTFLVVCLVNNGCMKFEYVFAPLMYTIVSRRERECSSVRFFYCPNMCVILIIMYGILFFLYKFIVIFN
jgi:hypothetical protein